VWLFRDDFVTVLQPRWVGAVSVRVVVFGRSSSSSWQDIISA